MIPTYRRSDFLAESISSALAQVSKYPFEVVVVDNNTDKSYLQHVERVVLSFKCHNIRYFQNSANVGMYGNWNKCIALARSKYVSILNDDDLLLPGFIQLSLDFLKANSHVKWCGCQVQLCGVSGTSVKSTFSSKLRALLNMSLSSFQPYVINKVRPPHLYFAHPHCGSLGVVFDRDAAISIGGYPIDFYPISDYVFTLRFAQYNTTAFLRNKLALYRIADNTIVKPSVFLKNISNDFRLRHSMVLGFKRYKSLMKLYAKLKRIRSFAVYKKLWGARLSSNYNQGHFLFINFLVMPSYLFIYFALQFLFWITPERDLYE
jgi:glycosyltransferase involved in cell wall biosynthesis